MAFVLFNVPPEDRESTQARLRAGGWDLGEEPHRADLAPGDLVLFYLARPADVFIARAVVATAAALGESSAEVALSEVEIWDRAVPMDTVLERVDPERANPVVQENRRLGFRTDVVLLTEQEYRAAVSACLDYQTA